MDGKNRYIPRVSPVWFWPCWHFGQCGTEFNVHLGTIINFIFPFQAASPRLLPRPSLVVPESFWLKFWLTHCEPLNYVGANKNRATVFGPVWVYDSMGTKKISNRWTSNNAPTNHCTMMKQYNSTPLAALAAVRLWGAMCTYSWTLSACEGQ